MHKMNREDLIKKWLDDELNPQELEAFKLLEDSDDLVRLSNAAKHFKAPEYNVSEELKTVMKSIDTAPKSTNWKSHILRIAAVLVLSISAFYYTTTLDTTIDTLAAQQTTLNLPDESQVTLNALSSITYNKKNWDELRDVTLEGEAYFKVAKGATFNVNTPSGIVSVLGTQFKVKHRNNFFEVVCYEGSVSVSHNSKKAVLKPGDSYLIIDGNYIATEKENALQPSWINNESYFKSLPFTYVLREFERQYKVTINSKEIDTTQLFTGSFTHENIDLALKSITLPLNITYLQNNNNIVLTRE